MRALDPQQHDRTIARLPFGRPALICGLLLAIGAPAAPAQRPDTRPARIPPVPRLPEYTDTDKPTEEMLGRAKPVIILPTEPGEYGEERSQRSGGAIARVPAEMKRLPEGYIIGARRARIEPEGRWLVADLAHINGLPDAPPMRLLPNSRLAMLEAVLAQKDHAPAYLLTGRVTEFKGNNYLLLENILEAAERPAPPPALEPQTAPAATRPDREPTAEEVIRELMQQRPRRSAALPDQTPKVTTWPEGTGPGETARWTEDTQLSDQAGRLVPGDPWWMMAFENLGLTASEQPLRILPNQVLETAMYLTAGGTRNTTLIFSGELTAYKGTNYLLLRKVMVRRDLGNFR